MRLYTFNARLTGYYPDDSPMEGGYFDRKYNAARGATDPEYKELHKLKTLQDHIDGLVPFVSVAGNRAIMPYGTILCIPSFNRRYSKQLVFKFVDTGSEQRFKDFRRLDICTRDESASVSNFLNAEHLVVALLKD